jgi:hypothetical protein
MHQPRIAGNVSYQYSGQPPFDTVTGNEAFGIRVVHPSISNASPQFCVWAKVRRFNLKRVAARIPGCTGIERLN